MGTSGNAIDSAQQAEQTAAANQAAANQAEINALSKEALAGKVAEMNQREAAAKEQGGVQLSEQDQIWHKELKAKIARDASEADAKSRADDLQKTALQTGYTPETDRTVPLDPSKRVKITDDIANGLRGDIPKEVPIAIFTLKEVEGKTVDKDFMDVRLQEIKDHLSKEGKSKEEVDKLKVVSTRTPDGQEVFGVAGIDANEANRASLAAKQEKAKTVEVKFGDAELSKVENLNHKDLNPKEKGLVNAALLLEQAEQAKATGHPGHSRNLARAAMVTLEANQVFGADAKKPTPEEMERAASFLSRDQIAKLNKVTDLDLPNHGKSTPPSQLPDNYEKDLNGVNRGKIGTIKQHVTAAKLDVKAELIEAANVYPDMAKLGWAAIKDGVNAAKNKVSDMRETSRDKKDQKAFEGGKLSEDSMKALASIKGDMAVATKAPSNIEKAMEAMNARSAANHGKADQARGR